MSALLGDCIISHGASQFLLERLFEQSDAYSTVVCAACGLLAIPAKPKNAPVVGMAVRGYDEAYCRVCETGAHVREVKMPYACKLLVQELMACCVAFRFRFDPPTAAVAAADRATTSSQGPRPISEKGASADQYNTSSADINHGNLGHDHGNNNSYNDDDDRGGGLGDQGESRALHVHEAVPRMEGAGPGGSVLAALPPPALDGILGRIETLLKAAAPDSHKRKRDHDDMDN